ncbi:hypothetical protein VM98_35680, partial [Streptomyces rubellomurinus subsp. indigoferus]
AWCYGTPGAARALFLAGTALGRADWRDAAVAAPADALADPAAWHLAGARLCHGTGGRLRSVLRIAQDSVSAPPADPFAHPPPRPLPPPRLCHRPRRLLRLLPPLPQASRPPPLPPP